MPDGLRQGFRFGCSKGSNPVRGPDVDGIRIFEVSSMSGVEMF